MLFPAEDIDRSDIHLQSAKREVRKFADNMVTSKEAWAEVNRLKETESMMRGIIFFFFFFWGGGHLS